MDSEDPNHRTPPQSTRADNLPVKGLPRSHALKQTHADGCKTTPIGRSLAGHKAHSSMFPSRNQRLRELGEEGKGRFVGPMPVRSFINRFLPPRQERALGNLAKVKVMPAHEDVLHQLAGTLDENLMTPILVQFLQRLLPGFNVVNTSANPDLQGGLNAPDVSIHEGSYTSDTITNFAHMSMVVELKSSASSDPFVIPNDHDPSADHDNEKSFVMRPREGRSTMEFVRNTENTLMTVGQLMAYANAQFTTQFRTFLFMVFICGPHARFIRWDRSGAIVTEPFAYANHPGLFLDFFQRYNNLTLLDRGYDPTVTKPTDAERLKTHPVLETNASDSLVKVMVPHPTADDPTFAQARYYIVERPKWKLESPFGRGSRAMPAYSLTNKCRVYMKDYWRYTEPGIHKESDTYLELHSHNVPNIPLLDMGNDLGFRTITQLYKDQDWAMKTTELYCHNAFRMTIHGVGRKLNRFDCSKEYVNAIKDAIEAHAVAFEKAKILHRDISVGNILMTQDGKHGLLIDWELSKKVAPTREGDVVDRPRRKFRTGTWQFISVKILSDPNHNHQYADDLESFFWVLLYVALTEVESTLNQYTLGESLAIFDQYTPSPDLGGVATGGKDKRSLLRQNCEDVVLPNNPALQSLLGKCATLLKVRYELLVTDDDVERYEKFLASLPPGLPVPSVKQLLDTARAEAEQRLNTSDRMVALFVAALEGEVDWPLNDAFLQRDFSTPLMTVHKQRLNLARLRDERPSEHKRFMTLDTPPDYDDLPWSEADLEFLLPGIPKALQIKAPPLVAGIKRSAPNALASSSRPRTRRQCFCSGCHRDADFAESQLYKKQKYRYFCPPRAPCEDRV